MNTPDLSTMLKSVFNPSSNNPKTPPIPTINSKDVQAAAEQERMARAAANGRQSTIFTNLAAESIAANSSPYSIGVKSTLG